MQRAFQEDDTSYDGRIRVVQLVAPKPS
jgi:hypothetical protein